MKVPVLLGRSILVLITLGLLLPLMACGRSGERSGKPGEEADRPDTTVRAAPVEDLADLTGTEWVLVSLEGRDPVEGSAITLEFPNRGELAGEAGCDHYYSLYETGGHNLHFTGRGLEVTDFECSKPQAPDEDHTPATSFHSRTGHSGYDGCRHFTGTYDASANDIVFTGQSMAELGCMKPAAVRATAGDFAGEAVGSGGDYRLSEGLLEIHTDAGDTFVFVALRGEIDTAQTGTPWTLEKFVEGKSVTPVLRGTEITLAFDRGTLRESGTVTGSAGCNTYTADYTYHHDSLALEPLAVTEMACEDPTGVMEQRYLSFLEDVSGYYKKIDSRLHLTVTGERELVFGPWVTAQKP